MELPISELFTLSMLIVSVSRTVYTHRRQADHSGIEKEPLNIPNFLDGLFSGHVVKALDYDRRGPGSDPINNEALSLGALNPSKIDCPSDQGDIKMLVSGETLFKETLPSPSPH